MRIGILFPTFDEVPGIIPYKEPGYLIETCRINGHDFGLLVVGVGLEASSALTDKFCEEFNPNYLIISGVCGGTGAGVSIGDLLIADCIGYEQQLLQIPNPGYGLESVLPQIRHSVGRLQTYDYLADAFTEVPQGVLGVDMESYGMANAAISRGIPAVVVRAVSDLPSTDRFLYEDFSTARKALDKFFGLFLQ